MHACLHAVGVVPCTCMPCAAVHAEHIEEPPFKPYKLPFDPVLYYEGWCEVRDCWRDLIAEAIAGAMQRMRRGSYGSNSTKKSD